MAAGEAAYKQLDGVYSATSGFMGGHVEDPTYEQVCGGDTGHAEVVQVVFNPEKITYERILARLGVPPERFVMVGNSLRSDILPAVQLGGRGVHVPYHVTWQLEEAELPEALDGRVRRIDRLGQLPAVLHTLR